MLDGIPKTDIAGKIRNPPAWWDTGVLIRQSVEGGHFGRRQESFPVDPNWLDLRQEGIPAGALGNPRRFDLLGLLAT
jgi:hypothetical protein